MNFRYYLPAAIAVLAGSKLFAAELPDVKWGPVTNGAQVSIQLKGGAKEIPTSQLCILSIRVRNVSTNETLDVYRANRVEDSPCSFTIISRSGKDISPKPRVVGGSGALNPLSPGQTTTFEFNLSSLVRLEKVGTYTVIAHWEIWAPQGKQKTFHATSNPIEVTVLSGGGQAGVRRGSDRNGR